MRSRHADPPTFEMLVAMIQTDAAAIALRRLEKPNYLPPPPSPPGYAVQEQAGGGKLFVLTRKP